jgi:pimeloyl-ACP methyl ester carboxylesterase
MSGWSRFWGSLFAPIVPHFKLPDVAVTSYLIGRNAPEALLNAAREAVFSVRPRVLTARIRAILACNVRNELAQVKVPILYLRATEDKLVPARCMEEILNIRPDTKVVSVTGPHLLIQREPQEIAELVANYLR